MTLAQQYARALFSIVTKASPQAIEEIHSNTRAILAKRGHEKLLPRIVAEYSRLQHLKAAEKPILTVARESDVEQKREAIVRMLPQLNIGRDELEVAIDPSIVGGFSIRTERAQYDASYKRALISLYQHLTT